MALLRLLHLPPTAHQSDHRLASPLSSLSSLHKHLESFTATKFNFPRPSLSTCSSISLTLPLESRKSKFLFFRALSLAQNEASIESSELEPLETEEEEVDEASGTRLLAQNVPWISTADDICTLFGKYGTVVDIELSMHNKTRNRGLAFVTMGSHEEALAALENLESTDFEGRTLKLNWAKPKKKPSSPPQPKPIPIHNLFVGNLPFQARAKDLKDFFSENNAYPVSAHIIFHENPRKSAGYGFASFNTKKEAEAALSDFQEKEFMGRPIRVARSKKFLRQETRESMQSDNSSSELN